MKKQYWVIWGLLLVALISFAFVNRNHEGQKQYSFMMIKKATQGGVDVSITLEDGTEYDLGKEIDFKKRSATQVITTSLNYMSGKGYAVVACSEAFNVRSGDYNEKTICYTLAK